MKPISQITESILPGILDKVREELPWYGELSRRRQEMLNKIVHDAVSVFLDDFAQSSAEGYVPNAQAGNLMRQAPPELTRAVSLQQALQLTELVVLAVEEYVRESQPDLLLAQMRYSREVAFAVAAAYAQAAEKRGEWDARLEALLLDSIYTGERSEEIPSRSAALGWRGTGPVAVLIGSPAADVDEDAIRHHLRRAGCDCLIGVLNDQLVITIGLADTNETADLDVDTVLRDAAATLSKHFETESHAVLGDTVEELLDSPRSAQTARMAKNVVRAYRSQEWLVQAKDLLPERALAGDQAAIRELVEDVYRPLATASNDLLETVSFYIDCGRSLEATARSMYVHTNTVRYRLGKVHDRVGRSLSDSRDSFVIEAALAVGPIHFDASSDHASKASRTRKSAQKED